MTYQEYELKLAELNESIRSLKNEYIRERAEYKVGERVKIIEGDKSTMAEVVGNKIGYNGEIEPIMQKVKKDGTLSDIRAYAWNHCKIEKI